MFDAFNKRDLQHLATMLEQVDQQMSVADCARQVRRYLGGTTVAPRHIKNTCPDCGKPTWHRRKMADGIERLWCFSCTYSEVM